MTRLVFSPLSLAGLYRLAFLTLAMTTFAANGPQEAVKEGSMIIGHWMKTKSVDSEMAYIQMQTLSTAGTVDTKKLLAVYHRTPDGASHFMVRLIEPEDIKGVTVLARKSASGAVQQSAYLPAVGRLRPLSDDGQAAPFLGSDFSYEDFLEEIPEEQVYERKPDRFIHGAECFVVRATPKAAGASAYAYRELYIDRQTLDLLRVDFFDHQDAFIKFLAAYEYDSPRIAGRSTRPRRAVMTHLKNNTSTILTVIQSRVNTRDIKEDIFSAEHIENWSDEAVDAFIYDLFLEVSAQTLNLN